MQNLQAYKTPWPFPRFIWIRTSGKPVAVLAHEFKFNGDELKGVIGSIGKLAPTFLRISTFFETEKQAMESLTNTIVKDVFDEPALM